MTKVFQTTCSMLPTKSVGTIIDIHVYINGYCHNRRNSLADPEYHYGLGWLLEA